MSQYQSFPDAPGASKTLDKLKALKFPRVEGRSFLDVGCNEGFFCGFAKFLGAERVVGVDRSLHFIERARARFPECEFLQRDWSQLPDGKFDVILLASALHYAEDQPALVRQLVEKLSDDGTLVLEIGIASSPDSAWIEVERGIDTRSFPTMAKLREVLGDYAWKWVGRSVSQAGDPVARHVVHVSRRRPIAYLLLQPPAYGKSSIAARLFGAAGVPVVSGDELIASVANGSRAASRELRDLVQRDYSPFHIDALIQRLFDSDAGAGLVALWTEQAGGGDFALDAFVPLEYHARVEELMAGLGYLPVRLQWDRVGPPLLSSEVLSDRAGAFYGTLPEAPPMRASTATPPSRGFVDAIALEADGLAIRGWAVDADGRLPAAFVVRIQGRDHLVDVFQREARTDVQRHLHLPHSLVGFRLLVPVDGLRSVSDAGGDFSVSVRGGGPVRCTGKVRLALGGPVAS